MNKEKRLPLIAEICVSRNLDREALLRECAENLEFQQRRLAGDVRTHRLDTGEWLLGSARLGLDGRTPPCKMSDFLSMA